MYGAMLVKNFDPHHDIVVADRTFIDQDPVPEHKRTWTGTTFALYWFSDLVTVSTWSAAASVVALGLTATDAIWITLVASLCNAIPTGKTSMCHPVFPSLTMFYSAKRSYWC
jgi:cytosine/uracil/thiamine/allantoin permease